MGVIEGKELSRQKRVKEVSLECFLKEVTEGVFFILKGEEFQRAGL